MSITPASYMSNADIMVWMQGKTGGMYENMTTAMQASDRNGDAEAALNKIRGEIADTKVNGGGDPQAILTEVNSTLAEYGDIPGVKDALQPITDKLTTDFNAYAKTLASDTQIGVMNASGIFSQLTPPPVKISSDESDTWTKGIDNTVTDLGKDDQLALINIQEMNSQINQAKQTASALMDSADKSSNDIISHIG